MNKSNPGDSDSQWRRYSSYLRLLAEVLLRGDLRGKVDLSGVVQQTLLEAFQTPQIAQEPEGRQRAWLKEALTNNLRDEIRKVQRDRRDVRREISLQDVEKSSLRLESMIAGSDGAPDANALRAERVLLVTEAILELPEMQREAIVLHHLQQVPVATVARQLNKTPVAVAGLLKRGFKTLRERLNQNGGGG